MLTFNRLTVVVAVVAVLVAGYLGYVNRHYSEALSAARAVAAAEIRYSKEVDAKAAHVEIAAKETLAKAAKLADEARRLPVPPECAKQDSLWQGAYAGAVQAADSLQTALAAERAANERLRVAAGELVKRSKPSFWARITPRVGVGGAAGIDPATMKFSKTVGVTFSWAI